MRRTDGAGSAPDRDPLAGVRTDADVTPPRWTAIRRTESDATVVDSIFKNPFDELKAARDLDLGRVE